MQTLLNNNNKADIWTATSKRCQYLSTYFTKILREREREKKTEKKWKRERKCEYLKPLNRVQK